MTVTTIAPPRPTEIPGLPVRLTAGPSAAAEARRQVRAALDLWRAPVDPVTTQVDVDWVRDNIDDQTVALIGSACNYGYGTVDPIEDLSDVALASGWAPAGTDRRLIDGRIIGSIERNGPVSGLLKDTFTPGLLHGLGGVCYQLLRLHPACDLPSVLILE